MSLAAACWWTLLRTAVLCVIAWPLAIGIERWIRSLADTRRPFAFAVLLAPFLFPELLVGYTFRRMALTSPWVAELLCAGLLFVRIVPVGVVTLLASPASLISRAAIHCRWILLRANLGAAAEWRQLALCYWYGPIRRSFPAMGLMSLVALQEFELAALLQSTSWTDWFIAAQRFGLERSEMLKEAVWPVAMQLPLLVGAIVWLSRAGHSLDEPGESSSESDSRRVSYGVMIYLGLALVCGCLIPIAIMARNLPSGLSLLLRQPTQLSGLAREILIASAISLCAGFVAWFVASAWATSNRMTLTMKSVWQILLMPGLLGSLLLSLVAVKFFQQTWLRPVYDSPLPWILALIVWLLPRAVLLRLWLGAMTRTEGVYLAEILVGSATPNGELTSSNEGTNSTTNMNRSLSVDRSKMLLFRLRDQPYLMGMGLLCYWAYLDLPTGYLLAPTGMASGLVRLYDFMHFGRSAALSAESLLFFGTPVVAMFVVVQVIRLSRRTFR